MNPPIGTDSDSTRERVAAAATAEFAAYGIAGARVERIAKAARTSKERVYAHFGSKEALYRYVFARELGAVAEATRMDPADLPGYAGRLHDYFTSHPEHHRLMAWGDLELAAEAPRSDDAVLASVQHKAEQIREAQRSGLLDSAWDPLDVLMLVNQIATMWVAHPTLIPSGEGLAERRAAIVAAVQRLFPAADPTKNS